MNVKKDFLKWFIQRDTYSQFSEKTVNRFIDEYVGFLGFDPFQVNDDFSNIEEIKERINSLTEELRGINKEYEKFQSKSHNRAPEAILGKNNYFLFLDELKEQKAKAKLDISVLLTQPGFQSIINEKDFYFQKGQDVFKKWLEMPVDKELENQLIELSKDYAKFQTEAYKRDDLKQVLELLFEIIAYCDTKARDKNKLNKYADKRTIAFAFVRMNNWIKQLILFKFKPDQVGDGSPKNAFDYLLDPANNATVLSENHRQEISVNLLGKEYHPKEFVHNLKEYFAEYGIATQNPANYTHLLTWIVYEFEKEWHDYKQKNAATQFAKIIENVKELIEADPEYSSLFKFEETAKAYVWIKDAQGVIGNQIAHYEIIKRKDNLFVEVHFEGSQREKDHFGQKIKTLPDKLKWFDWNKSKSITHEDDFKINDPDLPEKLSEALVYLENSIGNQLRETILAMSKKTNNNEKTGPLNQILYGPPGTGKTYNTINKAIKIINPDFDLSQSRVFTKKEYDRLVSEGRIVFATFHQSMSYEDFIEGIKPVLINNEEDARSLDPGRIEYEIQDGIFKKLCRRALGATSGKISLKKEFNFDNAAYYKMSIGGKSKPHIHEWCINNNLLALGWGNDVDFSSYLDLIGNWKKFRDKFVLEHPDIVNESRFHIQAVYTFLKMKKGDVVLVSKGNQIIDAVGIIKSGKYICDDSQNFEYYQFREVEWIGTELNSSPDMFVKKNITQQSIYEFYTQDINIDYFKRQFALSDSKIGNDNFVMIIDEINRGNIASIFGELIALIEDDKRLDKPEALESMLPYSKEKFGVPSNLFIIGTMNTADRSVEALDTALRRRFSFVEMPPKPDMIATEGLLKSKEGILDGIDLPKLLATINLRIAKLLDKDHQIGHSYFMNIEKLDDLKSTFQNKIIPLLQEYFFGDQGKTGLVMGEKFFEDIDHKTYDIFATFNDYDASSFAERRIYKTKNITAMDDAEFLNAINTLLNSKIAAQ